MKAHNQWFWRMVLLLGPLLPLPGAWGADGLSIAWTNNMLTISRPDLPGGSVEVWYLEAFCRSGSTRRDWRQTTFPHQSELLSADKKGKRLRLRTRVESGVVVLHDIRAGRDEVDYLSQD